MVDNKNGPGDPASQQPNPPEQPDNINVPPIGEQRAEPIDTVTMRRQPPFWRAHPDLWFIQVEANFARGKVYSDKARVADIIGQLEPDILLHLREFTRKPEEEKTYELLKASLMKRFAKTELSRTAELLEEMTLDDKRPSDLFRDMRDIAGEDISIGFLKTMWLKRLPLLMQQTMLGRGGTIEELVEFADNLSELNRNSVASMEGTRGSPDRMTRIERQLEHLSKLYARNSGAKRDNDKKPKGKVSKPPSDLCFYHERFGEKATKCRSPCNYAQKN